MAAAFENVSLGWRWRSSYTDIGISRQSQFFSLILPTATRNLKMRCRSAATEEEEAAAAAANTGIFSVTPSSMADFDYLGQSTKGDLNLNLAINGEAGLDGPIEDVARMEAQEAESLLNHLGIPVLLFTHSVL